MQKYICFRFDVDTHVCAASGMPKILEIFKRSNSHCTFFVHMGRAFSRRHIATEKLFQRRKPTEATIPIHRKLGLAESIRALIVNPKIGLSHGNNLRQAVAAGHEIGLHGGTNHSRWEKESHTWPKEKLREEIAFGLQTFQDLRLPAPVSFSSPCWQSPLGIENILSVNHFLIMADDHESERAMTRDKGVVHMPTNITGIDKNVGFVENLRAHGYSAQQILAEFGRQLENSNTFKMVFDHPFYIALHEPKLLSDMIDIAISKGYSPESLQTIYKKMINEGTPHHQE